MMHSPHKSLHAALKSTDTGKAGSVYTLYNSILYTVWNIEQIPKIAMLHSTIPHLSA